MSPKQSQCPHNVSSVNVAFFDRLDLEQPLLADRLVQELQVADMVRVCRLKEQSEFASEDRHCLPALRPFAEAL